MKKTNQKTLRISTLILVVAALLGLAFVWAGEAQAAGLPGETCTYDAGTNTRTCELWATTGTLSLPGTSVTIWGYADTAGGTATLPGPAIIANQNETVQVILHNSLSEATGLFFQGQAMPPDLAGVAPGGSTTYTFSASSPGTYLYEAALLPNAQHQVALGMFGAFMVRPAGAPDQAYASAATAFDDEAFVILSEVDPALNSSADPAAFDMRNFKARYWLINGKAYPQTDEILTTAGNQVLLRYINAGLEPHTMNLLGLDQSLLGVDGSALPYARRVVVNTIAPGQTVDALASVPAATLDGTHLALYDGTLLLHNNSAAGYGGMLTFFNVSAAGGGGNGGPVTSNVVVDPSPANGLVDVTVTATVTSTLPYTVTAAEFFIDVPGGDGSGRVMDPIDGIFDTDNEGVTATILAAEVAALADGTHTLYVHGQDSAGAWGGFATATLVVDKSGPSTGPVTLLPNPTDGSLDVTVSATILGATSAEYFVDVQGTGGSGVPMSPGVNPDEWMGTISTVDLASLGTGDHTIYVHGSNGVWGSFNFALLHLDKDGPTTRGLALSPNPSNGLVPVALSATGDDTSWGNSNIVAAEYFIDAPGTDGTGTPMTVNVVAPIASLDATIPAGLTGGTHPVYVHSQDEFGHWGGFATIDLIVNQTGPTTSGVTVRPSPNNGSLPFNPSQPAVRVDATITAASGSTVKAAEGFIDTVGGNGTGFAMTPKDGLFNSMVEDAYAFIPLTTINLLPEGPHQIWVHGKDNSGNWGTAVAADLIIDKTKPAVSNVAAAPNPTNGAASVTLTADAADSLSNGVISKISKAEYFIDTDPGAGNGTPMQAADGAFDSSSEALTASVNVLGLAAGNHTVYVRARDAAGNWSLAVSVILTVQPPDAIFADSFQSGNLAAWNGGVVGPVSVVPAAVMDGDGFGMAVTMAGTAPGYVTDLTPVLDASYHARFYFNSNNALTGNNQAYTIFAGLNPAGTTIFRVEFRRQNAGGGTYQIRAGALSAGAFVNTNWFTIANSAPHWIEIAWTSGNPASFSLYIDGPTAVQTLTGLNTSANLLDAVRLGPSAGLAGAASGTLYFDAFVSRRYTVIGP